MTLEKPEVWGTLRERYQTSRPRRLLSLDGGGIRGLITLQVLLKMEQELAKALHLRDFRLSQFFDYVAGTSTGAIIAAAIARGLSVAEILEFYRSFGREVFTRRRWGAWYSLYTGGKLEKQLKSVYGENATLAPNDLKTLLLVVTRNATTDSAWPISSNPQARYNDLSRADCNLRIPLWRLVRASTAAPVYFPPEVIEWEPGNANKAFVFVDGGTTAYNNPAFLLTRMAMEPAYRLGWERGESKLLVVSVGTGSAPVEGANAADPESNLLSAARQTLQSLMSQTAYDQDANCRTVGRCTVGPHLDREIGDLVPRRGGDPVPLDEDLGRAFLYARYDADLTPEGLARLGLSNIDSRRVSTLDATDAMEDLERVGAGVAAEVKLEHFGSFLNDSTE